MWRLFPRQIASDLRRFFGIRIADWHQGRMSSHELLELFGARVVDDIKARTRTVHIDFAPENGAVAKAMRGGERPELEQMVAQAANEMAVIRTAFVPNADTDQYDSRIFLSASRQREYQEEQRRIHEERQRIRDEGPDGDSMAAMWHQR